MYTDRLIAQHGKVRMVTSLGIEVIERQADIVPRIVEKYKETLVDFVQIGAFSGMHSGTFHTYDVDVAPPYYDIERLVDYSRTFLDPAHFVQPLVYLEKLASIYQFNPRQKKVVEYKEQFGLSLARRTLKASYERCMQGHWLVWQDWSSCHLLDLKSKEMEKEEVAARLNNSSLPLVVNISLDALQYLRSHKTEKAIRTDAGIRANVWSNGFRESAAYWQGRDTFQYYSSAGLLVEPRLNDFIFEEEECREEEIQKREDGIAHLLTMMRKPDLVVVSRSQKPIPTSLPDKRVELEARIMNALSKSGYW